MGVSTDAILFYGFCWKDERELLPRDSDGDSVEWTKIVAMKRGLQDPWGSYPNEAIRALPYSEQRAAGDRWCDENRAALDAWDEARRSIEKEFGCEISRHCSGECPMPYIYVKAGIVDASRGNPEEVKSLEVGEDWDAKLARFCKELKIRPPQKKPRWWLVSYWG